MYCTLYIVLLSYPYVLDLEILHPIKNYLKLVLWILILLHKFQQFFLKFLVNREIENTKLEFERLIENKNFWKNKRQIDNFITKNLSIEFKYTLHEHILLVSAYVIHSFDGFMYEYQASAFAKLLYQLSFIHKIRVANEKKSKNEPSLTDDSHQFKMIV